jgi:hypothetical protein
MESKRKAAETRRRDAQWEALKASAEIGAEEAGINVDDSGAVHAHLEAAMRDYAAEMGNPDGRELLPGGDWRIDRARREGCAIVAAMLYREATALRRAERENDEKGEAEYHAQQYEALRSAIIREHDRKKAKERPGRYERHGEGAGVSEDEAAEIMIEHNLGTKPESIKRKLRRWESKAEPPHNYPGRADRAQFVLWARTMEGRTKTGRAARAVSYRPGVTEAANMAYTGRSQPRGIF